MYKNKAWCARYLGVLTIVAMVANRPLHADFKDIFLSPDIKVKVENNINFLEPIRIVVESDKHNSGPFFCLYGIFGCFFKIKFRIDRPNTIYAYRGKPDKATERYIWRNFSLNREGENHKIRLDRKIFGSKDKIYLIYDYTLQGKKIKNPEKIAGTKEKLVNGNWQSTDN